MRCTLLSSLEYDGFTLHTQARRMVEKEILIDPLKPNCGDESVRTLALFLLVLLLMMDATGARAQVPVEWQLDGTGQLLGARHVEIDGLLYDVAFVDGLCVNLFTGSNNTSDFAPFTTPAAALAAAEALLAQVFIDSGYGSRSPARLDAVPTLTFGCDNPFSCYVHIPYAANLSPQADQLVSYAVAINPYSTYPPQRLSAYRCMRFRFVVRERSGWVEWRPPR